MEQAEVVAYTLDVLERLGIEYGIVGSMASIAYGEPRYTHDLDVLIDLPADQVSELCRAFPAPDWYVSEPAAAEAVRTRGQFNVIHTHSGNKIDFILRRTDAWGRLQFQRRQTVGIAGERTALTVHPEDVILGKLLYYKKGESDKHLRDVVGMLQVSGHLIDRDRVTTWAEKLQVADIWQAVLSRLAEGRPPESS